MLTKYWSQLPIVLFERRPWFIQAFQAALVAGALVLAWLLRFDLSLPHRRLLLASGVLLVVIQLTALRIFNLHRGWWHFASVSDAVNIVKAVGAGSLIFFLLNRYVLGSTSFPRSVYLLEALLAVALLSCARLISRVLAETARHESLRAKRVLVVGAGFAAQMVLRELSRPESGYVVVGCVDDDSSKLGIHIHDVSVLGSLDRFPELVARHAVQEVLIAIPSATNSQMRRITGLCGQAGVAFKTVPALRDIIRGDASIREFREVSLEDLLGRDPVKIDLDAVRRELQDRVVMITGAAGSIGSELCRQILEFNPAKIVCVDQSENGMFTLELELSRRAGITPAIFVVADVGDTERIGRCLAEHAVEFIFHAAAYKHVPVMEANVAEAVKNNIFVLARLLDVAEDHGCRGFLLISSDKAVNPTSVMGTSKRVGELMLAARPQRGMRCVAVRFGNVLGSSGSVVPILQDQLRRRQPLTITHPAIRRFFMTTHEAVSLVLQAFTIGRHGDILVLEMGTPVNILEMARTLIRLSGQSPDSVPVQFTGLRPGEKLEEELFYSTETTSPTACDKIKCARSDYPSWPELQRQLVELRASLTVDGPGPVRSKLKEIVPEYFYTPQPHVAAPVAAASVPVPSSSLQQVAAQGR
jgi:FlaA1/EpsC-like NDP-sugar epimerase